AVTTPLTACARPAVTAMTLTYVLPGALPATLAMQPSGATWSADLPPQPDGTVVRYQVAVELDDGTHLAFPDNPADPMYQLFLGNATPLYCERFDGDPRWMQGGAMGWEVAPPFGRAGDPDVTFTGVRMLGTNLSGSGLYPANTSTSITMPAIATAGFTAVHLQFRRWLVSNASDRAAIEVASTAVWQSSAELDHVDREWRFVDVELPPGEIAATWSIAADATGERGGWNLDDVCVVGIGKLATCGDGFVDATEECDGGDNCNADCTVAGGGCCSTGGDPGAALVLAFLAGYRKVRRSRVSSARCPR
ncbi:MAG: hypothetical protein ABI867_41575, partial [Kofleriaceae bacterium]